MTRGVGAAAGSGDLDVCSRRISKTLLGVEVGVGFGLGGHSRFSFSSSFAESPVCCDATLDARGWFAAAAAPGLRLCCCSKRPMRLATL